MYLISYCIYLVFIGQIYLFMLKSKKKKKYLFYIECKFYYIYTLNVYFIHVFTYIIFTHELI